MALASPLTPPEEFPTREARTLAARSRREAAVGRRVDTGTTITVTVDDQVSATVEGIAAAMRATGIRAQAHAGGVTILPGQMTYTPMADDSDEDG